MDMTSDLSLQESCMAALHHMGVEVRALIGKTNELETENAELRDTTYAWRTVDRLSCENAKLRELCADMWRDIPKTESCGWDMSTNTCTGSDECIGECSYWYRMRKLGIELS